jgi:hypothetical protein
MTKPTRTPTRVLVAGDNAPAAAAALADAGVAVVAGDLSGDDDNHPEPVQMPGLVVLDQPIDRGKMIITEVIVRKPKSGELRGVTMMALSQLDVGALITILPKITTPMLTKQEVGNLDPADLMQFGGEIMDFLLPRSVKTDLPAR